MPRSLYGLVCAAAVVAGSFASYEVWTRALDPGQVTSAGAAPSVLASGESKVPALIRLSPPGRHATSRGAVSRVVLLPGATSGPTLGAAAILPSARVPSSKPAVASPKPKPVPAAPHAASPPPVVQPTTPV